MGEVLSTFSKESPGQNSQESIAPVKQYCTQCGWADEVTAAGNCPRCGASTFEELALRDPPADGTGQPATTADSSAPQPPVPPLENDGGGVVAQAGDEAKQAADPKATELFTGARPPGGVKKKLLNVNRRSRAYSRQFVMKVANEAGAAGDGGVGGVEPAAGIAEEDPSVRPVVRKIVELTPQYQTDEGVLVVDALEKLLTVEKLKGTKCLEVADEVYMELIINEVNGYNFVAALLNVFEVSFEDFGLFLATPPDEGTMSLLEEAVCQESLDLFYEVLKMGKDGVLKGVLSCKELPEEVRQEVLDLMNDANSDPGGGPAVGSY